MYVCMYVCTKSRFWINLRSPKTIMYESFTGYLTSTYGFGGQYGSTQSKCLLFRAFTSSPKVYSRHLYAWNNAFILTNLLNSSHNYCHRNYTYGPDISTNTHVQINQLIFASYRTNAVNCYASLRTFMHQGSRTQR